MLVSSQYN